MSDKTEIQQIVDSKSDPDCFEPLYKKYYPVILKFVYKRIESLDNSREITAIVFSKALSKIGKYKEMGNPFSSWLYRIAINEINQFYRENNKARIISIDEKGILSLEAESSVHKNENLDVLKKSLSYLTKDEITLIELRFFEELSFDEVGQILGITGNNAKVKTYRVLDNLRTIFSRLGK